MGETGSRGAAPARFRASARRSVAPVWFRAGARRSVAPVLSAGCVTSVGASRRGLVRNYDLGVVLQLIEAADGNDVSGIDAVNLCRAGVGDTGLNAALVSDIVLDDVDERRLAILLNGWARNQGHASQRVYKQARVYKLIWEERIMIVVENRARFYRAGRCVNLIIDGQELAACDLLLSSAIERIGAKARLFAHSGLDRVKAVFRDRENYGYRRHLRDHCEGYRS